MYRNRPYNRYVKVTILTPLFFETNYPAGCNAFTEPHTIIMGIIRGRKTEQQSLIKSKGRFLTAQSIIYTFTEEEKPHYCQHKR